MAREPAIDLSASDELILVNDGRKEDARENFQNQGEFHVILTDTNEGEDVTSKLPTVQRESDMISEQEGASEAFANEKSVQDEDQDEDRPMLPPKDNTYSSKEMRDALDTAIDDSVQHGIHESGSESEIQSIMGQFGENAGQDAPESLKSPSTSALPVFHYPPRVSSLVNVSGGLTSKEMAEQDVGTGFSASKANELARSPSSSELERSSLYAASVGSQPPPPKPDPEPDLPFDFQRFLEQLRHRTADPVAKFLRSFLSEFGKKQWQVHEQVKIISDFLAFISNRMAQCDVWRTVSDAEFDNAKEGMEKLVMNRLYTQTFSPEIPLGEPSPVKGKRKGSATLLNPGRRGQHLEDTEGDEVLAQKVRIYGWIREEHLDVKPFTDKGRRFLSLAQKELSKIKSYRAPRDKIICVLNCCKVIFGFLRHAHSDQSADAFIPILIYTVLRANPDHLVSNVQYILRFRNQEKLTGEAGYYMSSLMGAVQFIENLDRTNITVSDEEFEKNVEAAVSVIAERHEKEERRQSLQPQFNEKSAPSRPEVTARHSLEGEQSKPRRQGPRADHSGDESDDGAAVAGLLRTIQKPLSTISRMFSDDNSIPTNTSNENPPSTPQRRISPARPGASVQSSRGSSILASTAAAAGGMAKQDNQQEAALLQASAEAAEAHRKARADHKTVVDTLSGMFPDLDKDVISDVVRVKEGRIGLAVEACLTLSR